MSESEKAMQIGAAVLELQQAKVESAHVQAKVDRVLATYREVGNSVPQNSAEPTFDAAGNLRLRNTRENGVQLADLLDQAGLENLIRERDQARARVKHAQQVMNSLGITGIS